MTTTMIPAGPELDAIVAEKVMGVKISRSCTCCHGATCPRHDEPKTPAYSTDLKAAWTVAEKVNLFKNCRHLHQNRERIGRNGPLGEWEWVVEQVLMPLDHNQIIGRGETPALAICRAALEVAMEESLNNES